VRHEKDRERGTGDRVVRAFRSFDVFQLFFIYFKFWKLEVANRR
jgi:hypothetical protein